MEISANFQAVYDFISYFYKKLTYSQKKINYAEKIDIHKLE